MLADRVLSVGAAKLLPICVVLAALFAISVAVNIWQVSAKAEAVGKVEAQLAEIKAGAESDLRACEGINRNAVATVQVLGDELHACRGQEQKITEQRDLAVRQRDRARRAADGEARMRHEAIEAIARTHEDCRRPICRALSDELLRNRAADANR